MYICKNILNIIIINLNLKKMKRKFLFTVLVMALSVVAISCKDDDKDKEKEKEKVTISFTSNDITLDLGSTNADLLKFATASDGSTIAVSGVNFDLAGEQTAIFTTGSTSESKTVKIKADKLAGTYSFVILDWNGDTSTLGNAWSMVLTKGENYNQINIPAANKDGIPVIFKNIDKLQATFDKEKVSIPDYTGGFEFMETPPTATFSFIDIKYGLDNNGRYALKSMELNITEEYFYTMTFRKTKD